MQHFSVIIRRGNTKTGNDSTYRFHYNDIASACDQYFREIEKESEFRGMIAGTTHIKIEDNINNQTVYAIIITSTINA
jgi:hypothetical protein